MTSSPISVNAGATAWVERLIADRARLEVGVAEGPLGATVIDAGARSPGSLEAGLTLARICLGGLAEVTLAPDGLLPRWPWTVSVRSSQPALACLASQYAGWRLQHGSYSALGSGPARALAAREPVFADLGYRDAATKATLAIESGEPPPAALVAEIAEACGVPATALTLIFAQTQSRAGAAQIAARVLEVALHKAHALRFPLHRVREGLGAAPLPPPHPDFAVAMGRANDAIVYGGRVQLFVAGPAEEARALASALPSRTSSEYGAPFAQVFRRNGGDFHRIDPMLFSPAEAMVTALETGETFRAGAVDAARLDASFG